MYYVRLTETMGRGVFANRDIKAGETICFCEILVLSPHDTKIVNTTDLQYYTFKYNRDKDCLVLGDGEIFNHADDENVIYNLTSITDSIGTRSLMEFTAIKNIPKDTQLFINYTRDIEVNPEKYTTSMVG